MLAVTFLVLRRIDTPHSQTTSPTAHLIAFLILVPIMLRGDSIILCLDLGSKSKITFNIGSIEVLSSFWIEMARLRGLQTLVVPFEVSPVPVLSWELSSNLECTGT